MCWKMASAMCYVKPLEGPHNNWRHIVFSGLTLVFMTEEFAVGTQMKKLTIQMPSTSGLEAPQVLLCWRVSAYTALVK